MFKKRVLEINKAFCVPCRSHNLNLVVGDAAKSSMTLISFGATKTSLAPQYIAGTFSENIRKTSQQKHCQQLDGSVRMTVIKQCVTSFLR